MYGKWWIQLDGFQEKFCLGVMANPPFEYGELAKINIEKVVQDGHN